MQKSCCLRNPGCLPFCFILWDHRCTCPLGAPNVSNKFQDTSIHPLTIHVLANTFESWCRPGDQRIGFEDPSPDAAGILRLRYELSKPFQGHRTPETTDCQFLGYLELDKLAALDNHDFALPWRVVRWCFFTVCSHYRILEPTIFFGLNMFLI